MCRQIFPAEVFNKLRAPGAVRFSVYVEFYRHGIWRDAADPAGYIVGNGFREALGSVSFLQHQVFKGISPAVKKNIPGKTVSAIDCPEVKAKIFHCMFSAGVAMNPYAGSTPENQPAFIKIRKETWPFPVSAPLKRIDVNPGTLIVKVIPVNIHREKRQTGRNKITAYNTGTWNFFRGYICGIGPFILNVHL